MDENTAGSLKLLERSPAKSYWKAETLKYECRMLEATFLVGATTHTSGYIFVSRRINIRFNPPALSLAHAISDPNLQT